MSAADPILPVFAAAAVRGWPKHAEGGRARPTRLCDALTRRYEFDAHCAQYECPRAQRRLAWATLDTPTAMEEIGGSIRMLVIIFDIDHAGSHAAGGTGANLSIDAWWALERPKAEALNTFGFRGRGGYKLVFLLPEPFVIKTRADAEQWTEFYLCSVAYLRRVHGVVADTTADWQRFFRLPHAKRIDLGKKGETDAETAAREARNATMVVDDYGTIGDPSQIGTWK